MSKSKENERIFVGKGVKPANYDLVNISISESKLGSHWFEYNGDRYIKLTVGALRQPDQYGKTHSVWINDYKPENANNNNTSVNKQDEAVIDDMPF